MTYFPDDGGPLQRRQFLQAIAASSATLTAFAYAGRCEAADAPLRNASGPRPPSSPKQG